MVEESLVIDVSFGIYEGKTYQEAFGDEKGGDLILHPEKLIIPEGETFYAVMNRLRLFFVKFWESDKCLLLFSWFYYECFKFNVPSSSFREILVYPHESVWYF